MDPLTIVATVITIVVVGGGLIAGTINWLAKRRERAGQVSTSTADVLWQQSQDMRAMLFQEKEKVEAQRDRMIDVQVNSLIPTLQTMNEALLQVKAVVEDVFSMLDDRTARFDKLDAALSDIRKKLLDDGRPL